MTTKTKDFPFIIETTIWSSGFLPSMIHREIEKVNVHLARPLSQLDGEERELMNEYLSQLIAFSAHYDRSQNIAIGRKVVDAAPLTTATLRVNDALHRARMP